MHRTVYSSLKVFHHPDRLQALAAGRHVAPLHVRLKPTNVCNHDCYFCAYRRDGLSLGSTMQVRDRIPRDKMREIVEDLIAMDVRAVTFSGGGEPLLYPWLGETLESLAAAGTAGHHAPFADTALAEIGRCRALEDDRFAIVDHYHFETDTGAARHPRCPMLRLLTVIAADGAVYACQDKAYTEAGRIGSIVDRRFRDLWHSDETQAWIDAFDARTCGHHCVAAGKNALLNDFLDTDRAHLAFV